MPSSENISKNVTFAWSHYKTEKNQDSKVAEEKEN